MTLTRLRAVALALSCAIAATCGPALALPIYHVYVDGGLGAMEGSSNLPLSRGSTFGGGGVEDNAFAAAGRGALRADTNTRYLLEDTNHPSGARITASAQADMTLDDVIVSGPAGPITTKYKVHLNGSLQTFANSNIPGGASSEAFVNVQLRALNQTLVDDSALQPSGSPLLAGGQLANFNGGADLVTPSFSVTANQPFTVAVRLVIYSESFVGGFDVMGVAEASAHFGDTLTFATDGPVFDLPPGYTANSVGGGIVNNQFVDVPEPALVVALPVLLALCRRPRSARRGGRAHLAA